MVERYIVNYDERGEQLHPSGDFVHYSDYAALEARIAALEAQLAERVRVKPLEWKKPIPNSESESGYGAGRSEYPLIQTENGWRVYCIPGDSGMEFPTKEAAKAAAQADFERRILSALEATPAPEQRELSAEDVATFDRALLRSGRKAEATPAPMVTEAMVEAAQRIRDVAMRQTIAARLPECGEFGGIAQDADWLVDALKAAMEAGR